MSTRTASIPLVAALAWVGASARAEAPAAPSGVVNLTSSASVEVPKDLLSITFSTTKEGPDAAGVQTQLKQALDAALAEARRVAKPGQLDVQTGNFSLYPRYNGKGTATGWTGTAELVVEGRDMAAIGQLAGRVSTLSIGRVGYGLSRELREKSEGDATARAIASYRDKAADYARQFGYTGYSLREVNVSSNEVAPRMPMAEARMKTFSAASQDEALPVEAGKGTVTVNVSGSVQLMK